MNQASEQETALKVVEEWNAAWMAQDLAAMKQIDADDFIQWHATIRKDMTKKEEFEMLEDAVKVMRMTFRDIKLTPIEGGVLQQCVGDLTLRNGASATGVPFAMVYQVRNGKIARCDEYMDGGALPKFDFTPGA